ncbi:unnamed protein product [Rotaria sp. Silwood1]|nr:unnamed protein product [Rotaria sp. Silwood1]
MYSIQIIHQKQSAERLYMITVVNIDMNDKRGYWLNEGVYDPTVPEFDATFDIEAYNDTYNQGYYLDHTSYSIDQHGTSIIDSICMLQYIFLGLGNMGKHMATNLIVANHHVTVFDIHPQAFDYFKGQKEAILASVPQKAVANSEFVILMLPNGNIVRDICQSSIFSLAKNRTSIIDCSTIDVQTSKELTELARSKQLNFVDDPVSGGTIGAQKGTLTFMVSSQPNDFQAVEPILKAMNLGIKFDLNKDVLAKLINSSSIQCWSSQTYNPCPGVVANVPSSNNYNGGFTSELMTKDLLLALDK